MKIYCKQCKKEIKDKVIMGCICGSFCSPRCQTEYHNIINNISLCPHCNCMTKTIKKSNKLICGKCQGNK